MKVDTSNSLTEEYAYTMDCSGKSVFYSVEDFAINPDTTDATRDYRQSYAIATARSSNYVKIAHTSFLVIVFKNTEAEGDTGCSYMTAIEMAYDASGINQGSYIWELKAVGMQRQASNFFYVQSLRYNSNEVSTKYAAKHAGTNQMDQYQIKQVFTCTNGALSHTSYVFLKV